MIPFRALMQPHRIVMLALLLAVVIWCAVALRWDWIPEYAPLALEGQLDPQRRQRLAPPPRV